MQKWNRWQDWANVVLGVVLFVTPFVFGAMANTTAAWTAYIGGVLLVLVGLFDLANPDSQTGVWTEGVLGVLVFVSPWVLGFSGLTMMAWSAWIVGVLTVVLIAEPLLERLPVEAGARRRPGANSKRCSTNSAHGRRSSKLSVRATWSTCCVSSAVTCAGSTCRGWIFVRRSCRTSRLLSIRAPGRVPYAWAPPLTRRPPCR